MEIVITLIGNNSLQAQWGCKLVHTGGIHSSKTVINANTKYH